MTAPHDVQAVAEEMARALRQMQSTLAEVLLRAPGYDWNSDPRHLTLMTGGASAKARAALSAYDALPKETGKREKGHCPTCGQKTYYCEHRHKDPTCPCPCHTPTPQTGSGEAGTYSLKDWPETKERLVKEVRDSEKVSGADRAIRIGSGEEGKR